MGGRTVWLSKGRFEDSDAECTWGFEGRTDRTFAVPSPGALLIVYDQDKLPVELWRVGPVIEIEPYFENGWTWFAASSMAELVAISRVTGIDFQDVAFTVLPADGGWSGKPIELGDAQIEDLFDVAGWADSLRR